MYKRQHPCLQPRGTFPDDEQEKPESAEIKRSTGIGVIIKPIKIKKHREILQILHIYTIHCFSMCCREGF